MGRVILFWRISSCILILLVLMLCLTLVFLNISHLSFQPVSGTLVVVFAWFTYSLARWRHERSGNSAQKKIIEQIYLKVCTDSESIRAQCGQLEKRVSIIHRALNCLTRDVRNKAPKDKSIIGSSWLSDDNSAKFGLDEHSLIISQEPFTSTNLRTAYEGWTQHAGYHDVYVLLYISLETVAVIWAAVLVFYSDELTAFAAKYGLLWEQQWREPLIEISNWPIFA